MKTRHTKGEWTHVYVDNKLYQIQSFVGQNNEDYGHDGSGYTPIANIINNYDSKANAKLIAAAPDMLQALIEIRAAASLDHRSIEDREVDIATALDKVEAAIKKSRH